MCGNQGVTLDEGRERAVRAELHRLLESASFRSSKRCREFLDYIVEHTICGPSGALKERSIGVELFQLPTDFDTGQHTIVRVTANEVRKKLAQHYLAENGSHGAVRIHLPPGSYSAEFRWEATVVEVSAPAAEQPIPAELPAPEIPVVEEAAPLDRTAPSTRVVWLSRRMIAYAAAAIVVAGAFSWWRLQAVKPVAANVKAAPAGSFVRAPGADLRISVGASNPYIDRNGRTWGPDTFFSGGLVLFRQSQRIYRTLDPDLYRRLRQGEFHYDIPLKPGSYELHLHFAETGLADFISAESSGEGQRLFRVSANGKLILDLFDVVADASGVNISDERVFRNISPAEDGSLHLNFVSFRGAPMLSGIEVLPVSPGTVRPIRIQAGWTTGWQDAAGQPWQADSYFLGGNALVRTTNPSREEVADRALYAAERWGHFSYALPVAEGRYRLTLKFLEGHYGPGNQGVGGLGSRVFDVYCNGVALLRSFDIMKQAGGDGKPVDKVFSGIHPNAQGKIVLSFEPIAGMACVNGIEVEEESK